MKIGNNIYEWINGGKIKTDIQDKSSHLIVYFTASRLSISFDLLRITIKFLQNTFLLKEKWKEKSLVKYSPIQKDGMVLVYMSFTIGLSHLAQSRRFRTTGSDVAADSYCV